MAVCFKLFGISELSARIPTALYGFLSICIAYFWGRKYFSHYVGLIAGIFVLSHLHFLGFSRMAMLDVPLGFFMAGSLLAYRMGLNKPSYFYLAGFGMGLAIMSKGVIGFFPACIIMLDVIWFKRLALLRSWKFWMMFIIVILVIAPWHIHQVMVHGNEFYDYYIFHNLIQRATTSIETHSGPIHYYFKYVFYHYFVPWAYIALILLMKWIWQRIRRRGFNKQGEFDFLILWFGFILLFFTVARTKLHWYIIPVYIPLAIMTAKMSLDNFKSNIFRNIFMTAMAVTAVQLLLLHPLEILEREGNKNIKTVCQGIGNKNETMIVYNVPIYAPRFYSDLKLLETQDGINALEKLIAENRRYLLATKKDFRDIVTSYKEKYKITRIAQSGDVVLGLITK